MAENVGVLFKKGSITNLKPLMSSGGKEGTFYLAEDERNLYFGTASGKIERIQGNVIFWGTLNDFNNNTTPPYSTDLIHFISDNNALVRWNGSKWVQLNATADSVNEAFTNITAAIEELQEGVAANAGNIEQNTKDIAANAAAIATKAAQTDLTALEERVTVNEGNIATNTAAIATKAAQTDLDATNDAVSKNAEDIKNLTDVVATKAAQADLTTLAGRVTANEGTLEDHAELIATKAAQTDVTNLTNRMDAAEDAIESNATSIRNNLKTFNDYKTANDARVGTAESNISKNTSDIAKLDTDKASVVDFNALSTKVDGIDEAVSKNAADIASNDTDIKNLQDLVATKADNTEFLKVAGRVTQAEADIDAAEANITNLQTTKADQTSLDATNDAVEQNAADIDALERAVATKAAQTDLQNLADVVDTKAAKTTVTALTNRVTTAEGTINNHGVTIGELQESVSSLSLNKVDKKTGYSLIADSEIERLAGIATGATRVLVDSALSDTSTNPVQNKVISAKIAAVEADVEAKNDALTEAVQGLSNTKADKSAMESADAALQAAIKAISDSIGTGTDGTTLAGRVSLLESTSEEHEGRLDGHDAKLDEIDDTIATLATKQELADAKGELLDEINEQIDAANAMTYKGAISAENQLPTSDVKVGDTYVVSVAIGDKYNAGDLLVAKGTEGEDGVIASGLSWDHVVTGYSTAFDQVLEVEDGNNAAVINLNTYTGVPGTSVGLASANDGLTIEAKDNVITFNMVWGSFDA